MEQWHPCHHPLRPNGNIIANDIRGPEIEDALSKIKF